MNIAKAIDITDRLHFESDSKKITLTDNIKKLFDEITAVASGDEKSSAEATGRILENYLKNNIPLISEFKWQEKQAYYDRLLLFGSHEKEITLMALIWPENTFSPIHYHQAWCVFGVYKGGLSETLYLNDKENITEVAAKDYNKNSWAYDSSEEKYYHRLGNKNQEPVISFHIYGVSPDNLHKINCTVS